MITLIDQRYSHVDVSKVVDQLQSAKTGAYDNEMGARFSLITSACFHPYKNAVNHPVARGEIAVRHILCLCPVFSRHLTRY